MDSIKYVAISIELNIHYELLKHAIEQTKNLFIELCEKQGIFTLAEGTSFPDNFYLERHADFEPIPEYLTYDLVLFSTSYDFSSFCALLEAIAERMQPNDEFFYLSNHQTILLKEIIEKYKTKEELVELMSTTI